MLHFFSTAQLQASSVTTQGLYLYDTTLTSNILVTVNNNTLLVGGSQIQSGGGGSNFNVTTLFPSFSTVLLYTSSIQVGPTNSAFAPSGQYGIDCFGSARFTQLVSTSQIITGAQYIGLQFG
jgi:hypothetical protein